MPRKNDDFNKISKALERDIAQKHLGQVEHRNKFLSIAIVSVLLILGVFWVSRLPQDDYEVDSEMTKQLKATYISSAKDYQFNWTIDDVDNLAISDTMKGDRLDDVVKQYGKPSDLSQHSTDNLTVYYSNPYDESSVHLDFKKAEDEQFYLESAAFVQFPIPEEIAAKFNPNGRTLTEDILEDLEDVIDRVDENILDDLLSEYEEPHEAIYSKRKYGNDFFETLELFYKLEEEEALVTFEKRNNKYFVLVDIYFTDY